MPFDDQRQTWCNEDLSLNIPDEVIPNAMAQGCPAVDEEHQGPLDMSANSDWLTGDDLAGFNKIPED